MSERNIIPARVIYSIAVSSPVYPLKLPRHRGGPRSGGRAWRCTACTAHPSQPRAADSRLGAVVVATHSKEWTVGQVVDVTLPAEK